MKSTRLWFLLVVLVAVSASVESQYSYRKTTSVTHADGGSPVPPIPPIGSISAPTSGINVVLQADGGSPVPPIPPTGFALSAGSDQTLA